MAVPPRLVEKTIAGLHDFLVAAVLPTLALALRLQAAGAEVLAVDQEPAEFFAPVPFRQLDLNAPAFADALGPEAFDLVTAVEVIEHLESPIGFLRNINRLLKPTGRAVITTPNVDNVPARLKFLFTGEVRGLDRQGEPTHVSPVHWDLFVRQYLPRAGLRMAAYYCYPPSGWQLTRRRYAWACYILAGLVHGGGRHGDNHVFVLGRAAPPALTSSGSGGL